MEDREKIKQELLEELKKEYQSLPLKAKRFTVIDILERYYTDICEKLHVENDWKHREAIATSIRKIICFKFGVFNTKDLPEDKRGEFREELEKFIKEEILKEKLIWN